MGWQGWGWGSPGITRAVIGRVVSAHLKIWRETTIFYTLIEVSGRMAEYLACVQLTIWAERANPNKKLEFPPPVFNFFYMRHIVISILRFRQVH